VSLALTGADAGHLTAAVGLTYALGFERALRGATAGDRVFAMIGAGSGVIGGGLVFRRAIGRGEVVVAGVATALTMFTLEIRHMKVLNVLDGRRGFRGSRGRGR
jgi:putative Mg2+ transporter-C (MgtC) family protein